jgi:hypothetical protein
MKGVKRIDNTKGQVIDWDKFLAEYPDREPKYAAVSNWGSAKHMRTVQELWKILPQGFVLMESDVIIRKNISFMWDTKFAAVGKVSWGRGNLHKIPRLFPFLCYLNVPLLKANGARYFDPERCWALQKGPMNKCNHYDTGASLLEDIMKTKPQLVCRNVADLYDYIDHFTSASWRRDDGEMAKWVEGHRLFWEYDKKPLKGVAVCVIGKKENKYAKDFVSHYKSLGVTKIYLYDNNPTDGELFDEVIGSDIKSGLVEVIDWRGKDFVQMKAYEDCYTRHGDEHEWMCFFDFDEYLRIPKKIGPWLKSFKDAECVLVNWRIINDEGKPISDDVCVKYDRPENDHVKCIVRGGLGELQFRRNPHVPTFPHLDCSDADGNPTPQHHFCESRPTVRLDHYFTRTAAEFREKTLRGSATSKQYNDLQIRRIADWFFAINERTPEKEKELLVNP